jgi:hypothetical protein
MAVRNDLRWLAKRAYLELLRALPDSAAISLDYFRVFGTFPNLAAPRTFSEKIQHMKLHTRHEDLPVLVDKVRVKDFVKRKLGESWLIPTLWHGERVTVEILRQTPKPAIMKACHSSSQVCFLNANTNLQKAAQTANAWRCFDYHLLHREWAYGKARREILIEPCIGEPETPPDDYKFWVLDGVVRFVQVDQGRFQRHTRQFYTPEWNRLDFTLNYPSSPADVSAPPHLADMLNAARTLAEGHRFVRVDLYDTLAKPLFGELTFAPEAGLCRFDPKRLDTELGESWAYPLQASARH